MGVGGRADRRADVVPEKIVDSLPLRGQARPRPRGEHHVDVFVLSDEQVSQRQYGMEQNQNPPIIVTRHTSLVEYLREMGFFTGPAEVKAQVQPEDVAGRHVIGVLPLHLAALADRVTTVDLEIPAELRGAELTLDQLRSFARSVRTYRVTLIG